VRQDGGVPAFWDGWYQKRADALEALRLARKLHPKAFVHLIERQKAVV
jgi:hypothetical protein